MQKKIMIIDDDPSVRDVYNATLTSQGYLVATVPDGESALEAILKDMPDLILLDIMMPKVYGIHILDIIKSTPEAKNIKVIMLTALSDEDTIAKAKKYGATDFLVKSEVTMPTVLEKIKQTLAS